jgi:hypothetical protein
MDAEIKGYLGFLDISCVEFHYLLYEKHPPKLPKRAIDLLAYKIGNPFLMLEFSFIRVYGAKIPPKMLPGSFPDTIGLFGNHETPIDLSLRN